MNAVTSRLVSPPHLARRAGADDSGALPRVSIYGQIERSIGDDAADKLIEDFGGRRLYIPLMPSPGDRITASIGLCAALAMAREFGGDRLPIPLSRDSARRRARIVALRAEGSTISQIAHELHCTERYVYKVLAIGRASAKASASASAPTPTPTVSPKAAPQTRCNRAIHRKS
jgi:Mor family transcriptional regulator